MIIKILPDNTVSVQGGETINSTYSHKASTAFIWAIADALPYKGAMEFDPKQCMIFNSETALIQSGENTFAPDTDISIGSADLQAFCNAVWDNGGRRLYEAKQKRKELENNEA